MKNPGILFFNFLKNRKNLLIQLLLLFIFITFLHPHIAQKALAEEPGKIVMVVIDRISLDELIETPTPNIDRLLTEGAVGVMNTNTGSWKTPGSCYLTIGAGTRGRSPGEVKAFNSKEVYLNNPVGQLFTQRTGISPGKDSICVVNIQEIINSNLSLYYDVVPGALGETLKNGGIKTAVIGNADTVYDYRRYAPLIAMDAGGIVPSGDISRDCLIKDPLFPNGLRTDYKKVFELFQAFLKDNDFLIVETGDTSRLEEYKGVLKSSIFIEQKREAIRKADEITGRIAETLNLKKDLLIIISPTPSGDMIQKGNNLTPVIFAGKDINRGLLTSATTRRRGIITNIDIPFTLPSFFNLNAHPTMIGGQIYSLPSTDMMKELKAIADYALVNYGHRPTVVKSYIALQIVVFFVTLYMLLNKKKNHPLMNRALKGLLLLISIIPITLLIISLIPTPTLFSRFFYLLVLAFIITFILEIAFKKTVDMFLFANSITFFFILLDIAAGAPLMKNSVLGYCPIIGARFYGIGNEYMGVFIGSLITGSTLILDRLNTEGRLYISLGLKITAGLYLLTILVLASPALGANVGGTITAAIALFVTYLKISNKRVTKRELFYGILGVTCILLFLIYFDMNRIENAQSHVGKTIGLIKGNGISIVKDIIIRKLSTNFRIFKYTIWTRVFILSLIIFAVIFYKPANYIKSLAIKYPYTITGWTGSITASFIALMFNDSGVAPAATCVISAVTLAVYLILEEKEKGDVK